MPCAGRLKRGDVSNALQAGSARVYVIKAGGICFPYTLIFIAPRSPNKNSEYMPYETETLLEETTNPYKVYVRDEFLQRFRFACACT